MLKQKSCLEVKIEDKLVCEIYVNNDCPLGLLHDGLMQAKGWVVNRMVSAQKEEEDVTEEVKKNEEEEVIPGRDHE